MTKHIIAAAFLTALPIIGAISMCCVGDWDVAPGPYAGFDTSTNTPTENMEMDVGCKTCCQAYASGTRYGRLGTDLVFEVVTPGTFTVGYGTGDDGRVAGGATLLVEFSQEQVRLESNADGGVEKVYKRATFDPDSWNVNSGTCATGYDPGFRFGRHGLPPTSSFLKDMCTNTKGVVRDEMTWQNMFCNDGNGFNDGSLFDECFASFSKAYTASFDPGFLCEQSTIDSLDANCRGDEQMCGGIDMEPFLQDGVLMSRTTDIEFEQDILWKNEADGSVIGTDWGMQKVFIGAQKVAGRRDSRCFHTDEDNMTGCTDTEVSENGIKFQLELNQQRRYPHGVETFWDDCTADGSDDDILCATCFAVAITTQKGSLTVSSHSTGDGTVSWTLLDDANNDVYDLTYAFESLYNRNADGNGIDAPSNFAKARVLTDTSEDSGSVRVCALKRDYDPSESTGEAVFLYDPEVRVRKRSMIPDPESQSDNSSSSPSAESSANRIVNRASLGLGTSALALYGLW